MNFGGALTPRERLELHSQVHVLTLAYIRHYGSLHMRLDSCRCCIYNLDTSSARFFGLARLDCENCQVKSKSGLHIRVEPGLFGFRSAQLDLDLVWSIHSVFACSGWYMPYQLVWIVLGEPIGSVGWAWSNTVHGSGFELGHMKFQQLVP